jgi:hypothetical protein
MYSDARKYVPFGGSFPNVKKRIRESTSDGSCGVMPWLEIDAVVFQLNEVGEEDNVSASVASVMYQNRDCIHFDFDCEEDHYVDCVGRDYVCKEVHLHHCGYLVFVETPVGVVDFKVPYYQSEFDRGFHLLEAFRCKFRSDLSLKSRQLPHIPNSLKVLFSKSTTRTVNRKDIRSLPTWYVPYSIFWSRNGLIQCRVRYPTLSRSDLFEDDEMFDNSNHFTVTGLLGDKLLFRLLKLIEDFDDLPKWVTGFLINTLVREKVTMSDQGMAVITSMSPQKFKRITQPALDHLLFLREKSSSESDTSSILPISMNFFLKLAPRGLVVHEILECVIKEEIDRTYPIAEKITNMVDIAHDIAHRMEPEKLKIIEEITQMCPAFTNTAFVDYSDPISMLSFLQHHAYVNAETLAAIMYLITSPINKVYSIGDGPGIAQVICQLFEYGCQSFDTSSVALEIGHSMGYDIQMEGAFPYTNQKGQMLLYQHSASIISEFTPEEVAISLLRSDSTLIIETHRGWHRLKSNMAKYRALDAYRQLFLVDGLSVWSKGLTYMSGVQVTFPSPVLSTDTWFSFLGSGSKYYAEESCVVLFIERLRNLGFHVDLCSNNPELICEFGVDKGDYTDEMVALYSKRLDLRWVRAMDISIGKVFVVGDLEVRDWVTVVPSDITSASRVLILHRTGDKITHKGKHLIVREQDGQSFIDYRASLFDHKSRVRIVRSVKTSVNEDGVQEIVDDRGIYSVLVDAKGRTSFLYPT